MTTSAQVTENLQSAVTAHQNGDLAKAEKLYKKVLKKAPDQPDALNLLGVLTAGKGDVEKAIALFDRAINAAPQLATVPFNKGNALRDVERLDEARAAYEAALACEPAFHDARLNLGALLQQNGDTEEALTHFTSLIKLAPAGHPHIQRAHYNIGKCHQDQGRLEEAETALLTALKLNPNDPDAHFAIANVYADMRRHQDAIDHIQNAIKINPKWSEAFANLGNFLCALDQHEDALALYNRALAVDPDNMTARVNRGLALLSLGRLAEGWEDYSYRAVSDAPYYRVLETDIPKWGGESLEDKSVLVWHEQGLGEEILYASLLREFVSRSLECTWMCSSKLKGVFARSFSDLENLTIVEASDEVVHNREYDFQTSLIELGQALRPSVESFPASKPYLKWDKNKARAIREDLENQYGVDQKFIGISWSSANPVVGKNKTIPLAHWPPVLTIRGTTFVNVQYGVAKADFADLPHDLRTNLVSVESINLDGALDDTLCLLAALDHLITCSNTTAHLSAAAGLPTWVLVPAGEGRIWYWFTEGTRSPWYNGTRIYRQSSGQSIQAVVQNVARDLTEAPPY